MFSCKFLQYIVHFVKVFYKKKFMYGKKDMKKNHSNRKITKKSPSHNNSNVYIMYGTHAVLAAIKNTNRKIRKIWLTKKTIDKLKVGDIDIPYSIVDNAELSKITNCEKNHQGMAAEVETIFNPNTKNISLNQPNCKMVILDQIKDPQNIGAIIRSAAAFGINKIILPQDNCPNENAVIAKAACGNLEIVQIYQCTNLNNFFKELKKEGYWIAGLDGYGNNKISDLHNIDKLALIIGSEDKGMRKLTTESCDFLVKIPISENVESLNASCAASVIFYAVLT